MSATAEPKDLSWKATRRGRRYCAPACGSGCTWEQHQKAKADAREVRALMGKGWRVRVHENMGWHSNIWHVSGYLSIGWWDYAGRPRSYTAYLVDEPSSGSCAGRWTGSASTPRLAVMRAIRKARTEHRNIGDALALVKGAV